MHRADYVVGGFLGDYLLVVVGVVAAFGKDAGHRGEVARRNGLGALLGVDVHGVVDLTIETLVRLQQVGEGHVFGIRFAFRLVDGAVESELLSGELVQIAEDAGLEFGFVLHIEQTRRRHRALVHERIDGVRR